MTSSTSPGLHDLSTGVAFQFTWSSIRLFTLYEELKTAIRAEYKQELEAFKAGNRPNIDPFVYDLFNAVLLVEEYGEHLTSLVWISTDFNLYTGQREEVPGRYDMCECQNLLKCPNGTASVTGSNSIDDCVPEQVQVLRRISVIPPHYVNSTPPTTAGNLILANLTDFWEISGADFTLPKGPQSYPIGSILLQTFDVAVVTMNLNKIHYNMTYGKDYRIGVYVDCKPCPTQYSCDYTLTVPTCTTNPSIVQQRINFNECKQR